MGLNKFPITLQDCYDILNYTKSLNIDSFNKEISNEYLDTLEKWNRFLGTLIFIMDTINSSNDRGISIQGLIDKGYIK